MLFRFIFSQINLLKINITFRSIVEKQTYLTSFAYKIRNSNAFTLLIFKHFAYHQSKNKQKLKIFLVKTTLGPYID